MFEVFPLDPYITQIHVPLELPHQRLKHTETLNMKNKTKISIALKIFSSFFKTDDFFFLHEKAILNFTSVSLESQMLNSASFRDTKVWMTFCFSVPKYVPVLILSCQRQINVKIFNNSFYSMTENLLIYCWVSTNTHHITKNEKINGVKMFYPIYD